ncbi:hypothetical protein GIB67_038829 [Kingdonia uniflora]|uniref:KIB1-4 beta-propeller domain-containing protein n=1 Tax=Kingdonia uniflora TaxID=39325 RepID=A0A7J7M0Z7_9MAGN|nr:hypothetical protein GIB67_038829 [Kingdonia uniflora]
MIGLDGETHVFNPISRLQIRLPSFSTFRPKCEDYILPSGIQKAILSLNPPGPKTMESWEVMAICAYTGQFHALTHEGILMICDVNSIKPEATVFASPSVRGIRGGLYLAEMSGELHMVIRKRKITNLNPFNYLNEIGYKTTGFDVYKLDVDTKKWVQLQNLGGNALFLGNNSSFSLLASNYPEVKGNCIYFTNNNCIWDPRDDADMGVYDLSDTSINLNFKICGGLYMVKMFGELHMVARKREITDLNLNLSPFIDLNDIDNKTMSLDFYKLDVDTKKWIMLQNFGDNALFLGKIFSFLLLASNNLNLKGNCIYLTDNNGNCNPESGADIGINDLTRTIINFVINIFLNLSLKQ